eukprot:CAMPEP_0181038588 /NCGR_PEP_ID=MMETSP1070-20121207/10008_1 /TAXON_ID=265543 /ORGANISM="Minutocellus polymorphus, Strain NH13" /LENGTH=58 /DNA_ID=CAMNT_0023116367 /DNA_START=557 /DNA_END=734 /DNA_ORIENTATION=-
MGTSARPNLENSPADTTRCPSRFDDWPVPLAAALDDAEVAAALDAEAAAEEEAAVEAD